MSQTPNPNDPRTTDRPNPSVESTRIDDAQARETHENASGFGSAAGAGLGCLGMTFAPFVAIIAAILAALVFVVVGRGCGGGPTTQRSDAGPAQVEALASDARAY